ncbi:MAG: ribose-5-phosphate isomerase [Actinobacteria bacterium]|nr:ribose-5-phosphate isomerase [Actinomycetota bacterium]NBY15164.1 ribose-5-phosphate isomerase [Actinomycetota bacterium]
MRIHLATDHAGLEFKDALTAHLTELGYEVVDHGAYEYDAQDDYPGFCISAAQAVALDPDSLGIVFGGSGNGEQISANKVAGIRAALCWSISTAQLAREHNNANICSIGARQHSQDEAFAIIDAFLMTPFTNEERHIRRINQIRDFENS